MSAGRGQRHGMTGLETGLGAGGRWPVVAGEAELTLQLSLNLPQ